MDQFIWKYWWNKLASKFIFKIKYSVITIRNKTNLKFQNGLNWKLPLLSLCDRNKNNYTNFGYAEKCNIRLIHFLCLLINNKTCITKLITSYYSLRNIMFTGLDVYNKPIYDMIKKYYKGLYQRKNINLVVFYS